MRREPPRSPGPSSSPRPRTPGPSWCPWSRRASMWSSPRWTTARWTASPGACCPPTTWAAPRPTWTPTRFPPTSTRCSRRPRPAVRRLSSSTALRRRSRRTPISCVTPPSAACACSPRPPRALCAPAGWSFCPPASRPRSVRRRPPRRPGKTSRLGWRTTTRAPPIGAAATSASSSSTRRRSSSSAAIARLAAPCSACAPTSAWPPRWTPARSRSGTRSCPTPTRWTSRATRRRSPISARRVALRKRCARDARPSRGCLWP